MPTIRTSNTRHKHALVERLARVKAAERRAAETAKAAGPAKA